jgi:hypothetical protein
MGRSCGGGGGGGYDSIAVKVRSVAVHACITVAAEDIHLRRRKCPTSVYLCAPTPPQHSLANYHPLLACTHALITRKQGMRGGGSNVDGQHVEVLPSAWYVCGSKVDRAKIPLHVSEAGTVLAQAVAAFAGASAANCDVVMIMDPPRLRAQVSLVASPVRDSFMYRVGHVCVELPPFLLHPLPHPSFTQVPLPTEPPLHNFVINQTSKFLVLLFA